MNEYRCEEMEIDIVDLMFDILSRWRILLSVCLICAVMAGGLKLARMKYMGVDENNPAAVSKQTAIDVMNQQLTDTKKQLAAVEDFIANSPVMHLEASTVPTAKRVYKVVLSGNSEAFRLYHRDPADEIVTTYVENLRRERTAANIGEKLNIPSGYANDLYFVSYSESANTISITGYGSDEKMARVVVENVCDEILSATEALNKCCYPHHLKLVSDQFYKQFSDDVAGRQTGRYAQAVNYGGQIDRLANEISKAEKDLAKLRKNDSSGDVRFKSGIKFGLIGFFAAGFIMSGIFFMMYCFKGRLHTASELVSYFRLPVLAEMNFKGRENLCWIDKLLMSIFGKASSISDDVILEKLAAFLSGTVLPTDRIAFVASGSCPQLEVMVSRLATYLPEHTLTWIENLRIDPKSTEAFNHAKIIIGVEERNVSRLQDAEITVDLAGHFNKHILGFVVL